MTFMTDEDTSVPRDEDRTEELPDSPIPSPEERSQGARAERHSSITYDGSNRPPRWENHPMPAQEARPTIPLNFVLRPDRAVSAHGRKQGQEHAEKHEPHLHGTILSLALTLDSPGPRCALV